MAIDNLNILPEYILKRPKTGWFSPETIFLENNLKIIIQDFFDEKKIKNQNIFNYNKLLEFFEEYPKKTYKIKRQVLTIILFQIWYDKIIDLV